MTIKEHIESLAKQAAHLEDQNRRGIVRRLALQEEIAAIDQQLAYNRGQLAQIAALRTALQPVVGQVPLPDA